MNSKLLDVAHHSHCSFWHAELCVLASLAIIVIVSVCIPSAELRPQVVEALLMLPSQALLLLCHLDSDLIVIIITYIYIILNIYIHYRIRLYIYYGTYSTQTTMMVSGGFCRGRQVLH